MDGNRFNPALEDLLRDPLTRRMMASDNVEMAALVALLTAVRRRLADPPEGPARG